MSSLPKEIALPKATLFKILKKSLEKGGLRTSTVSSSAKNIIEKATCMFVLYMANAITVEIKKGKKARSTANVDDVMTVVNTLNMPTLTAFVNQKATTLNESTNEKKEKKRKITDTEEGVEGVEDLIEGNNGDEYEDGEENEFKRQRVHYDQDAQDIEDEINKYLSD